MSPEITKLLCGWYQKNKRVLPWRQDPSPYHVWISEIMLQQTRVEAVIRYYERFLQRLPDTASLAECPDDVLLKLWEGLGYYSRARNLKKAARVVMEQYGGNLPADYDALLKLPGIGPYTAGAIASIAFALPVPAVDGNVLRVFARLSAEEGDLRDPAVVSRIRSMAEQIMPEREPDVWNQAVMELGALVCIPNGAPKCGECPVCSCCLAFQAGLTDRIPFKSPPPGKRKEKKTVLVLRDGTCTLLHRRKESGLLAGMFEFPCLEGHCSEEETVRFVEDTLGLMVLQIRPLPPAKHIFTHIEWDMTGFLILTEDLSKLPEQMTLQEQYVAAAPEKTQYAYPIPAAFRAFASALKIEIGQFH